MTSQMTVERYAELRAEMDAGALRDEALARVGMSPDQWVAAQREWLEKMGTELERGRFELTNRYSRAFLERQRALTAPAPPSTPIASPASAIAPVAAVSPPLNSPGADAPAVPSYLRAPVKPAAPVISDLRGTTSFVAPRGPALPFAKKPADAPSTGASDAPAAPKKAPVVIARPPDELRGTTAFVAPRGEALPFPKSASAPQPQASAPKPAPPPAPSPPVAPAMAAPTPAAAPAAPKPDLRGTSLAIDTTSIPLPFRPGAPAAPPPPSAQPSTSPASKAPRVPNPHGETSFAVAVPAEALPFRGAAASALPSAGGAKAAPVLTLEQYASITAELAASPAQEDAIRKKYGIADAGVWKVLDTQWQTRFLFDPASKTKWLELTEQYRRWLVTQHPRG